MTIQEAAVILNEVKHEDYDKWHADADDGRHSRLFVSGYDDISLTEFEAIAVAEKYQRDGVQAKP